MEEWKRRTENTPYVSPCGEHGWMYCNPLQPFPNFLDKSFTPPPGSSPHCAPQCAPFFPPSFSVAEHKFPAFLATSLRAGRWTGGWQWLFPSPEPPEFNPSPQSSSVLPSPPPQEPREELKPKGDDIPIWGSWMTRPAVLGILACCLHGPVLRL